MLGVKQIVNFSSSLLLCACVGGGEGAPKNRNKIKVFYPSLKMQYLDHIFLGLVLHSSTVTVNITTTEHIGKKYGKVILLYLYLKRPLDLN